MREITRNMKEKKSNVKKLKCDGGGGGTYNDAGQRVSKNLKNGDRNPAYDKIKNSKRGKGNPVKGRKGEVVVDIPDYY